MSSHRLGHTHYMRHGKWRLFLAVFFMLIFIMAILSGLYLRHTYVNLPVLSTKRLLSNQRRFSEIRASNGTIIWGHNRGSEMMATKKDIPPNLKNALTSIEDRKFYTEGGFNFVRTAKAALTDLIHRNRQQGGSTLCEQLIKDSYFPISYTDDKTVNRKIQEIMLADKVSNRYSKSTIMKMYINKVFMGSGIYGMKTASRYYFDKPLKQLSYTQAAILAGMVQSPVGYDPYIHPRAAKLRRNTVLRAMVANKKLSSRKAKKLCKTPLDADIVPLRSKIADGKDYEHTQLLADDYTQSVVNQLRTDHIDMNNHSVDVKTPLDINAQRELINIIGHDKNIPWPDKKVNVAATVVNNKTGQAIAQVGNRHKKMIDSADQAISTERSTGSTIKPILDYAPAMDDLGWGTGHSEYDTHFDYPGTDSPVYDWDDEYQGKETLARALMNSRNIPAIKTLHAVGLKRATRLAAIAGLDVRPLYSSAIGADASTAQMASAYSSLANYGNRKQLSYLSNYHTRNRKPINVNEPSLSVMSPQTAFMLNRVLEHIPQDHELGQYAHISGVNQAGKTGSNGYSNGNKGYPKDAISDDWYIGYTKKYTIALWIGYTNPKHYLHQENADKIVQGIYREMMKYLITHNNANSSDWSDPGKLESFDEDDMKQYDFKDAHKILSPSLGKRR